MGTRRGGGIIPTKDRQGLFTNLLPFSTTMGETIIYMAKFQTQKLRQNCITKIN